MRPTSHCISSAPTVTQTNNSIAAFLAGSENSTLNQRELAQFFLERPGGAIFSERFMLCRSVRSMRAAVRGKDLALVLFTAVFFLGCAPTTAVGENLLVTLSVTSFEAGISYRDVQWHSPIGMITRSYGDPCLTSRPLLRRWMTTVFSAAQQTQNHDRICCFRSCAAWTTSSGLPRSRQ